MPKYSKDRIRINEEIKLYKMDECIESIIEILRYQKESLANLPIPKKRFLMMVETRISKKRKYLDGCYVPAIENIEVDIPTANFLDAHWADIRILAAEEKVYIIPEPGIFWGTFEQYAEYNKRKYKGIIRGLATRNNDHAQIINRRGGKCDYLDMKKIPALEG